jgi:hypothetical protein
LVWLRESSPFFFSTRQALGAWIDEAARGLDSTVIAKRGPPGTLITEASFNGASTPAEFQVRGNGSDKNLTNGYRCI